MTYMQITTTKDVPAPGRIQYYDFLKFLAIIGVITIHTTANFKIGAEGTNSLVSAFIRQASCFAVPLFVCLSGFFLARKKVDSRKEYFSFLRKQIPRVYIPFLFWSVITFIIAVVKGKPLNSELFKVITFQSQEVYYFILLIIQYYLLLPVLQRLANSKGLILSAFISIISCICIFYVKYYLRYDLPVIVYGGSFTTWLIFFSLGLYYGKGEKIRLSAMVLVPLLILMLLVCFVESYYLFNLGNNIKQALTAVKLSSFAYSFVVIVLILNLADNRKYPALSYIGQLSFGVYLSHMLILPYAASLARHVPFSSSVLILAQAACILITLLLCITIGSITRSLSQKIAVKYLGF